MNLKQKLYELKNSRAQALEKASSLLDESKLEEHGAEMEKVKNFNSQIEAVEKLLQEQERFAQEPQPGGAPAVEPQPQADGYAKAAKALAAAARKGFKAEKAADGLMQEGSDPDGGYAVPADVVTKILKLREAKESLLDDVTIIKVTAPSGRRTFQTRSQNQGFATVAEAGKFGRSATPLFTTLSYQIEKRGGVLPVTNELLSDSDNNIVAVVQEWLADEGRATANREILEVISAKTPVDLADLDGILKAWVGLGSVFRSTSKLITNDDGLLWLGTLKDANGRSLLAPNPADTQQLRLAVGPHTLPVKTYDNATIPTKDGKIPMILGDLKEGVIYWDRQQFTVKVSDVAVVGELNAFEQDLILWRGSLRDDCTQRDGDAYVNGYIAAAANADSESGSESDAEAS